jgi:hypothetical protein
MLCSVKWQNDSYELQIGKDMGGVVMSYLNGPSWDLSGGVAGNRNIMLASF